MKTEKKHYLALDSLRGIAALTVVLCHIVNSIRGSSYGTWVPRLETSPVGPMMMGQSPVMLFFVLSGFVLTLTSENQTLLDVPAFWIKRIFRIWMPYVVAFCFFLLACRMTAEYWVPEFPSANGQFRAPFELQSFINHVILVGSYQLRYMGITWSLVHEMRISLLFPLVMLILYRRPWYVLACVAFITCVVGKYMMARAGLPEFSIGMRNTLYCLGMFIQGMIIAKYRLQIAAAISGASRPARWFLIAIAVSFYVGGVWDVSPRYVPWFPLGTMIGCMLLVALGVTTAGSNFVVHSRASRWLGRISYSLYLWHPFCLVLCFRLLHAQGPWFIGCAVILASLAVSDLSYRLIEKPSIKLGAIIAKAVQIAVGRLRSNPVSVGTR